MSELDKWSAHLRRSLREARDQRHDAEAVPGKVTGVVEDLVHLAAAAQGEAFLANRRAYRFSYDEYPTGLQAPTEADRETYRRAHANLLEEAETLLRELRSQHFSPGTLREVFGARTSPSEEGAVHSGEKAVALGFEIASYLTLRDSEGVARKGLSVAARHSGKEIEAAVKVGQYLMGPSPLTLANDVTKVVGEAVAGMNKQRLQRCVLRVSEAVRRIEALEHPGAQAIASPLKERPSVTPVIESPRRMPPPQPPSRRHPRNEGPSSPRTPGF